MSKLRMAAAGFAIAAVGAAGVFAGVSVSSANGDVQDTSTSARAAAPVSRSAATATSQVFRVAVNSDGSKSTGSKGTHSDHLGPTGQYEVFFPKNVTACVAVATVSENDHSVSVPLSGEIGVAYRSGAPKGFFVETRDSAGTPSNRDFMLVVTCKVS